MSIVISYDSYMESMVMWDVYGRKDNHHDIELEQAECCRCRRWMTAFKVCKALPDDYSVTQVDVAAATVATVAANTLQTSLVPVSSSSSVAVSASRVVLQVTQCWILFFSRSWKAHHIESRVKTQACGGGWTHCLERKHATSGTVTARWSNGPLASSKGSQHIEFTSAGCFCNYVCVLIPSPCNRSVLHEMVLEIAKSQT